MELPLSPPVLLPRRIHLALHSRAVTEALAPVLQSALLSVWWLSSSCAQPAPSSGDDEEGKGLHKVNSQQWQGSPGRPGAARPVSVLLSPHPRLHMVHTGMIPARCWWRLAPALSPPTPRSRAPYLPTHLLARTSRAVQGRPRQSSVQTFYQSNFLSKLAASSASQTLVGASVLQPPCLW
jgi:hypothetical protein